MTKINSSTILNKIFILFSLENRAFTVFSGIIQNPAVSVWYYHLPFLSNVEIQVRRERQAYHLVHMGEGVSKVRKSVVPGLARYVSLDMVGEIY